MSRPGSPRTSIPVRRSDGAGPVWGRVRQAAADGDATGVATGLGLAVGTAVGVGAIVGAADGLAAAVGPAVGDADVAAELQADTTIATAPSRASDTGGAAEFEHQLVLRGVGKVRS